MIFMTVFLGKLRNLFQSSLNEVLLIENIYTHVCYSHKMKIILNKN